MILKKLANSKNITQRMNEALFLSEKNTKMILG